MFRKRLVWQLFPSFLAVTLIALIAATAYFSYMFHEFHLEQTRTELRTLAEVAAPQLAETLARSDTEQLDALCKQFGRASEGQVRFTIITPVGKVMGDSSENPAAMEDHSDREEIIEALRTGYGESVRLSPTLGKNMMYVAVPIRRGAEPVAVVRTSIALTAIDRTLHDIYVSVVWAGVAIALAAAFLSLLISRSISQPIVRMRRIARLFAQGQLNIRVPAAGAAELDELANALNEMATQLQDRILTITRQRNELEAILGSLVEGVFAVDARGRIVSVNNAAANLLNIDRQRAQGRNIEEVIRNVGLQQFVRDTLHSDRPTETDVSFPEEGGRFFHVHGARLADPGGQRSGAVIVLSDMTRIHRLENLRRDFVANVSHELKTPVTSIQGFVEALQEGGLDLPEQAQRYVDIIAKHAERLNAIIDDLLSLSRLEEGGQKRALRFEKTRVRPVLETAVQLSGIKAEQKRATINLTCGADVEARINGPLLEQAVANLVDNAVKYSDEGATVDITARRQDKEITIAVTDEGCGIPQEHLDRIFERFYVVDKSRSRKLGGTGLGLAIVKHIAQVHGGHVSVQSTPGTGSTFTIHLPDA
jgi:two-component system phosphate regulon sensor histidine kinase PhoR